MIRGHHAESQDAGSAGSAEALRVRLDVLQGELDVVREEVSDKLSRLLVDLAEVREVLDTKTAASGSSDALTDAITDAMLLPVAEQPVTPSSPPAVQDPASAEQAAPQLVPPAAQTPPGTKPQPVSVVEPLAPEVRSDPATLSDEEILVREFAAYRIGGVASAAEPAMGASHPGSSLPRAIAGDPAPAASPPDAPEGVSPNSWPPVRRDGQDSDDFFAHPS